MSEPVHGSLELTVTVSPESSTPFSRLPVPELPSSNPMSIDEPTTVTAFPPERVIVLSLIVGSPSGPETAAFPMQADLYLRLALGESWSVNGTLGVRGVARPDDGSLGGRLGSVADNLMTREHYVSRYWCQRTLWESTWEGPSPIADPDWHPADIQAALKKRGHTLAGLSAAHGYHPTAAGQDQGYLPVFTGAAG